MTRQEFLEAFVAAVQKDGRPWYLDTQNAMVGPGLTCPLAFMSPKTKARGLTRCTTIPAEELGLDKDDARAIAKAADNSKGCSKTLQERLWQAARIGPWSQA